MLRPLPCLTRAVLPLSLCPAQDPGPTNGVLASVPGHPLWTAVLDLMQQRWREDPDRHVVTLTGSSSS